VVLWRRNAQFAKNRIRRLMQRKSTVATLAPKQQIKENRHSNIFFL